MMAATLNVHDILSRMKELDKEEQLILLENLIALIKKKDEAAGTIKLSKISGIGSQIWRNVDIDEYIDQERQW